MGKGKAAEIAILKLMLDTAAQNPDIIKYPNILVMGQGGGFEGAAAILGANNFSMSLPRKSAAPESAK